MVGLNEAGVVQPQEAVIANLQAVEDQKNAVTVNPKPQRSYADLLLQLENLKAEDKQMNTSLNQNLQAANQIVVGTNLLVQPSNFTAIGPILARGPTSMTSLQSQLETQQTLIANLQAEQVKNEALVQLQQDQQDALIAKLKTDQPIAVTAIAVQDQKPTASPQDQTVSQSPIPCHLQAQIANQNAIIAKLQAEMAKSNSDQD